MELSQLFQNPSLNALDDSEKQRISGLINKTAWFLKWPDADVVKIQLLPGYVGSRVMCFELGHKNQSKILYAKLSNSKRVNRSTRETDPIKHEYDQTLKVFKLFYANSQFSTVHPLLYLSEIRGFVMEPMQGKRMDLLLKQLMKPRLFKTRSYREQLQQLLGGMNLAGQWLVQFQKKYVVEEPVAVSSEYYRTKILRVLDTLNTEFPGYMGDTGKLKQKIDLLLFSFNSRELQLVAKHNDYAPWNINLEPINQQLTVFDFADLRYDSRYYDVAHFYRSLELLKLKPIHNRKIINQCQNAFLQGLYGETKAFDKQHYSTNYYNLHFNLASTLNLLRILGRQKGFRGWIKKQALGRYLNFYRKERQELGQ